jgi:photosystem II stability/assembly factor-like uncharacterized protein
LPHFGAIKLSNAYSAIGDPAEGNTQRDGTAFLGGFDGLFKSVDGGEHWTQMETLPVRLMAGLALSPKDSGLPLITITTYGGGAYTSCDAGETWNIQNDNLTLTRLTDIAFSPNYALDHTILTASGGRLIRSESDGSDWIEYELGYQGWRAAVASRLSQVGVPDPLTRMLLNPFRRSPYAMVLAISPDFSSDGILYFGTRQHGIFKSSDRGQTTSAIWDGKLGASPPTTSRSPARISSLAISSNYTEDRTLFAGVHGEGILKTVDGGENWQFVLRLVEQRKSLGRDETSREHKPEKHHVWLALSPHYASDQTLFAASGNRLFKSIDGGGNWKELRIAAIENRAYIAAVAVSTNYSVEGKRYQNEHSGQMLLVSVQGKGLFQSSDGGSSFTQIGSELIDNNQVIRQIEFSPDYAGGAGITGDGDSVSADIQRNNVIYASSTEELFRSTDGGDTWQVLARPVRYEDAREVIRFEGKWQAFETYGASARTVTHSDVTGSKASLDFVGTGVRWIGARSTDGGIAHVYLDGRPVSKVDQYAPSWEAATACFQVTDLAYAPHTITIETSGTRNAKSAGHYIHVDALDVFGTTTMVKMEEK